MKDASRPQVNAPKVLMLVSAVFFATYLGYAQQEPRAALEPMAGDGADWEPVLEAKDRGNLVMRDWQAGNPTIVTDLGVQDGFYRWTQLQGHLIADGLQLFEVPDWWLQNGDFPYRKKDTDKEVFFVDHFSITRFLGGYHQAWKHNGRQLPANDLAFVDENGKVGYRLNLVEERLKPYLDNGYVEFTIGIENTPWALSREEAPPGPFGNTSPPRDWEEWKSFITAVCEQLREILPPEATDKLKFKIGNEYNQKKSFTGTHEDYLKLYDFSAAGIHKVFPDAEIMPGEIGGGARHKDNAIDYPDLFQHFVDGKNRAGGKKPATVSVLARSSHSFPHVNDLSPSQRVNFSVDTLVEVLEGKPDAFVDKLRMEHHQFGVLGAPDDPSAVQSGVRNASWHFQTIFRLKASGYLDNVWSWEKAERIDFPEGGETHLLNGIGWLYSILDHLEGDRMYLLGSFQKPGSERDVTSVAFVGEKKVTMILASWSPADALKDTDMAVSVPVPRSILPFSLDEATGSYVRLDRKGNPFEAIRAHLDKAGILKEQYQQQSQPTAQLRNMASDFRKGKRLVKENLDQYIAIQQASFQLKPLPSEMFRIESRPSLPSITASTMLRPDDLLVVQFELGK